MIRIWLLVLLLPLVSGACQSKQSAAVPVYQKTSDKKLEGILDDLSFALTEHNLRIVNKLHIGKAVQLRGNNKFPDYEVILYCSISFAEDVLGAEPELINACPGKITVRSEGNKYIISAPLWPENTANAKVNTLTAQMNQTIRDVVDFSTEHWLSKTK